ncbi:hypothetical protein INT47_009687 [Mucor saturninus]|uniref:Uncharacterized protein n=1 Tax=Mucor saturninus TaxID=64648 RepID=A0A8H7QL29_9FUNG|nr:hypothetical protein INT47_009687 [Mucor saturninus]
MVNQRRSIAPRPTPAPALTPANMEQIVEMLSGIQDNMTRVEDKVTNVEGELVTSNTKLVTMDARLGVIIAGTREAIKAIDNFGEEVPATATSEPSNVAVVEAIGLAGPSHKTSVEVNVSIIHWKNGLDY